MESHSALDAPPDYNSIFGPPSSASHPSAAALPHRLNVATTPPSNMTDGALHRGAVPPSLRTQARGGSEDTEHSSTCFCCKNKSPAMVGLYTFLFILGVFIPGTLIGLGLGLMFTGSGSNNDDNIPLYLLIMGVATAVFVCWHTMALVVSAYLRSKEHEYKLTARTCSLRLCHVGGIIWWGTVGYFSALWALPLDNVGTLFMVLLGSLVVQYIMILYCVIECLVDCVMCCNQNQTDE